MSQAQEKAFLRREGALIWAFTVCAMGAELGRHSKEPLLRTQDICSAVFIDHRYMKSCRALVVTESLVVLMTV